MNIHVTVLTLDMQEQTVLVCVVPQYDCHISNYNYYNDE